MRMTSTRVDGMGSELVSDRGGTESVVTSASTAEDVHGSRSGWELRLIHVEMSKFAVVGGVTFLIDAGIFFALKTTVLAGKPMTANILAILIATIVNYVLSREWAFKHRGGRQRKHEAALFFFFSGIGIVLATTPLWVSNYLLDLRVPHVSQTVENTADFISAKILGTGLSSVFRWWSSRKLVFPDSVATRDKTTRNDR